MGEFASESVIQRPKVIRRVTVRGMTGDVVTSSVPLGGDIVPIDSRRKKVVQLDSI